MLLTFLKMPLLLLLHIWSILIRIPYQVYRVFHVSTLHLYLENSLGECADLLLAIVEDLYR